MSKEDHMTPVQDIFNKFLAELSNHNDLFDDDFVSELKKAIDESTLKDAAAEKLILSEKAQGKNEAEAINN